MAVGERTFEKLQREQASALKLEHRLRHSKRNNLIVFGAPDSMAYSLPAELALRMQRILVSDSLSLRANHSEVSLPFGHVGSAQAQDSAGENQLQLKPNRVPGVQSAQSCAHTP